MNRFTRRFAALSAAFGFSALFLLSACEQATEKEEKPIDIVAHIRKHYPDCNAPAFCGDLVYVDCNSGADGPAYYLDRGTGKLLGSCGGWVPGCIEDGNCETMCPPKAWTCER